MLAAVNRTAMRSAAVVAVVAAVAAALYLLREDDRAGIDPAFSGGAARPPAVSEPAPATDSAPAAADAARRDARARTSASGHSSLQVVVRFDDGALAVGAKVRPLAEDEDADAEPEPDPDEPELLALRRGPGRPGGGSVPSFAYRREFTTGPDGRATLTRPAGVATRLRVEAPGAPRVVAVAPPDWASFDVVVTSEPALRGRVATDEGPLLGPAPLSLVLHGPEDAYSARGEIAADGSFVFRGLRPGRHRLALEWKVAEPDPETGAASPDPEFALLRFEGPGVRPSEAASVDDAREPSEPRPPASAAEVDVPGTVDVVLRALGVVRGRLVGKDGAPRGRRPVRATFALAGEVDVRRSVVVVAERDGTFRIAVPADGVRGFVLGARTSSVVVSAAAHGALPTTTTFPGDASRGLDVGDLVVGDPSPLRFLATDLAGTPIAGARISERHGRSTARRGVHATTDAQGRADAAAPAASVPMTFVAEAARFAPREFVVAPAERTAEAPPAHVRLAPVAQLVVRVRSGPVDDLRAFLRELPAGRAEGRRFEGGQAVFDDAPSGAAFVVSLADRAGPLEGSTEVPALLPGERRIVLLDPPPLPCFVVGSVARADGSRASAHEVRLAAPAPASSVQRTPIGPRGAFAFPPLYRRGTAPASVRGGADLFAPQDLELTAGRVEAVFVALPSRRARLTVEDAAGAPAPRRDYVVEAAAGGRRTGVSFVDGRWETPPVPADAIVAFEVFAGGASRRVVAPPGMDDVSLRLPALCDLELVAANPRPVGVGFRVEIRGVDDAAISRRLVRWLPPHAKDVRFRTRLVAGTYQASATTIEFPDDAPPVAVPLVPPRRVEAAPDRVASAEW
jgi:hypothetical protein